MLSKTSVPQRSAERCNLLIHGTAVAAGLTTGLLENGRCFFGTRKHARPAEFLFSREFTSSYNTCVLGVLLVVVTGKGEADRYPNLLITHTQNQRPRVKDALRIPLAKRIYYANIPCLL